MEKDLAETSQPALNLDELDRELEPFLSSLDFDSQNPEDIVFDNDKQLKGATLTKLVCAITDPSATEASNSHDWMLTYRAYLTPIQLLAALEKRFQHAGSVSDEKTRKATRLRVFSLLRLWVDRYYDDFHQDRFVLCPYAERFLHRVSQADAALEKLCGPLRARIVKLSAGELPRDAPDPLDASSRAPTPKPKLPKNFPFDFLDCSADEVARQILMLEWETFSRIRLWELVDLGWTKPDRATRSPNVVGFIQNFNNLSSFVCRTILCHESQTKRIKAISKWAKIVTFIRNHGSLNSMMVVCSGLNRGAVFRLKDDFAALPAKYKAMLAAAQTICSRERGYVEARKYIKNCNPPCIPYLGMSLTDLTFIEEGNLKYLPGGNVINFFRCRSLARVLRDIQQYQQTPYRFEVVQTIRDIILCPHANLDEDAFYRVSEYLVPRAGRQRGARPDELDLLLRSTAAEGFASLGTSGESNEARKVKGEVEEDWSWVSVEFRRGYPFYAADSPTCVITDRDTGNLSAATMTKIVEHLTQHARPSGEILLPFLGAYRHFISPEDLLHLLLERSNPPAAKNLDANTLKRYNESVTLPVFIRCFNVLKTWLETYREDFSAEMMQRVEAWAKSLSKERDTFAKVILTCCQRVQGLKTRAAQEAAASCLLDSKASERVSLLEFHVNPVATELRRIAAALYLNLHVTDAAPHDPLAPTSVARALYDAFLSNLTEIAQLEISLHGPRGVQFIVDLVKKNFNVEDVVLSLVEALERLPERDLTVLEAFKIRDDILAKINHPEPTTSESSLVSLKRLSAWIRSIPGEDMVTSTMINVKKLQDVGQVYRVFKQIQSAWKSELLAGSYDAISTALRYNVKQSPSAVDALSSTDNFRFSECEVSSKDQLRLLLIGMLDTDGELRHHVRSVVKERVNVIREALREDIRKSIRQSLSPLGAAGQEDTSSPITASSSSTQEPNPHNFSFSSTSASRQAAVRSLLSQLGKKSPSGSPSSSSSVSPSTSPPKTGFTASMQIDDLPEDTRLLALSRISEQFPNWTRTQIKVPLLTRAMAGAQEVPIIEVDAIYRKGVAAEATGAGMNPGQASRDTILLCIVRDHITVEDMHLLLEVGKSFKMQNASGSVLLNCVVLHSTADPQAREIAARAKVLMLPLKMSSTSTTSVSF